VENIIEVWRKEPSINIADIIRSVYFTDECPPAANIGLFSNGRIGLLNGGVRVNCYI